MNRLEVILESIIGEAERKAASIINEARREIKEKEAAGYYEQQQWKRKYEAESRAETEKEIMMLESQRRLERSRSITRLRAEFIESAVNKAKARILSYPAERYFEIMYDMFSACAPKKGGSISFNKRDLERMPNGFIDRCRLLVTDGHLVLESEPVPISGGFIISSGRIYENCSVEAMFEDNERLRSAASSLITEVR